MVAALRRIRSASLFSYLLRQITIMPEMRLFFWAREKTSNYADAGSAPHVATVAGSIIDRGSPSRTLEHNNERRNALISIWSAINESI